MKTTNCSFQIFKLAIATTVATVIMCGITVRSAQAGYIVTLQQVGPNVVATGSGAIDLTGLSFLDSGVGSAPGLTPSSAIIFTGPTGTASGYSGGFTGPTSFGSGGNTAASAGSGNIVGLFGKDTVGLGFEVLVVPDGYVSDSALSDSSTYNNATFSTLGVTLGTYVWTWGTGADQNFTLKIGAAGVPDFGSTFSLFLLSFAALFGASRLRSQQSA
jgi:hypothetical protein